MLEPPVAQIGSLKPPPPFSCYVSMEICNRSGSRSPDSFHGGGGCEVTVDDSACLPLNALQHQQRWTKAPACAVPQGAKEEADQWDISFYCECIRVEGLGAVMDTQTHTQTHAHTKVAGKK